MHFIEWTNQEAVYRLMVELEEEALDKKDFLEVYEANVINPQIFYLVYEKRGSVLGFISVHTQKLLHHVATISFAMSYWSNERFLK